MSKTTQLVEAIVGKKRDFTIANELSANILQERVTERLNEERKTVFKAGFTLKEAKEPEKCEMCGSKEGIKTAPDGTKLCRDCDVED